MCLAIPGKILSMDGECGVVDFLGARSEVNLSLIEASIGKYVLVHAGYAIEILDKEDAEETVEIWKELLSS